MHQEACVHLHRVLAQIREAGAAAGVALNPATPLETLAEARDYCDLVLVMSVNPGFGGQSFIAGVARQAAPRPRLPAGRASRIEVDGGVSLDNAAALVAAGANLAGGRQQRVRRRPTRARCASRRTAWRPLAAGARPQPRGY